MLNVRLQKRLLAMSATSTHLKMACPLIPVHLHQRCSRSTVPPTQWCFRSMSAKCLLHLFVPVSSSMFFAIPQTLGNLFTRNRPSALFATESLSKSPIFTAWWLSTSMNLLGSFVIFNLFSSKHLQIVTTRLSQLLSKLVQESTDHLCLRSLQFWSFRSFDS